MNLEEALRTAEICIRAVLKNTKARAYGKCSENIEQLIEKDTEALETITRLRIKISENK